METRERVNTTKEDINPQAGALNDLPVASEQADETKGGAARVTSTPIKTYQAPGDPSIP